mmetsp:Transcript_53927/g.60255  ORF Transcript_53927/g.60255 Transcript_53927/m.60255 type:complete len:218 (-) Transcript_53927:269-922(-)
MRLLRKSFSNTDRKLAFWGAQAFLARYSVTAFVSSSSSSLTIMQNNHHHLVTSTSDIDSCRMTALRTKIVDVSKSGIISTTRLFSSSAAGGGGPMLTNIGKGEMEEIIEDYEEGGREDSGYVVMDVREKYEIEGTGKVSPNTHTLPLSIIGQDLVFDMDEDQFEITCGFPKPTPDETLVFTCAAGIRSTNACSYASQSGYTKLVNYKGGAYDWFTGN